MIAAISEPCRRFLQASGDDASLSSYLDRIGVIVGDGCLGCLVEFGDDGTAATLSSASDIKAWSASDPVHPLYRILNCPRRQFGRVTAVA